MGSVARAHAKAAIRSYLRGKGWRSAAQIAEGTGLSIGQTRTWLDRMESTGREVERGGSGARLSGG